MPSRRDILKHLSTFPVALLAGKMSAAAGSQPQSFPIKPVVMVTPYAAGNSNDVTMRLVAKELSGTLGQQVVVDNRPGAGGVISVRLVSASKPDGHTLLATGAAVVISQLLLRPQPYDVLREFSPVSTTVSNEVLVLVGRDSSLRSITSALSEARARGKRFMVGISQLGTTQHLAAELLKLRARADYTIVPFRSASALATALQGGAIDVALDFAAPMLNLIHGGQIKALASCGSKRMAMLQGVPTVAEAGVADFDISSWGIVLAPANTPDSVIQQLSTEIRRSLATPDVSRRLTSTGNRILGSSPGEARDFLGKEVSRLSKLIREANIVLQ